MNETNISSAPKPTPSKRVAPNQKLKYRPFTKADRKYLQRNKHKNISWLYRAFNYEFDREFLEIKISELWG